MREPLTRRTLLGSVGVAGAGLLAGCLGDDEITEANGEDIVDEAPGDDEYHISEQPDDAAATFVTPEDGDTVQSPVTVQAEVEGIELAPAGEKVVGEGHLHVLVDHECFGEGQIIPGPSDSAEADGIHHWSDGQEEGELELGPGDHQLCLQITDGVHRAFGESDQVSIAVEE